MELLARRCRLRLTGEGDKFEKDPRNVTLAISEQRKCWLRLWQCGGAAGSVQLGR